MTSFRRDADYKTRQARADRRARILLIACLAAAISLVLGVTIDTERKLATSDRPAPVYSNISIGGGHGR